MEEKENPLETLLESAEEYGKTTYELFKLKAIDKTSGVVSSVIVVIVVFAFALLFFVLLNIGIALLIGEALGNKAWLGFVILAAFYGIVAIVLNFFMNKWMKKVLSNMIIRLLLD